MDNKTFENIFEDTEKSKELDKLLLEVQEKHIQWFKDNSVIDENGYSKPLAESRTLYYPGDGTVGFKILIDLPEEIRMECEKAFEKVYGNILLE